jgi:hypothetical protein
MTEEEKIEQPVQEESVQEEVKVEETKPVEAPENIHWKQAREVMQTQKAEIEALRRQMEDFTKVKPPPEPDEFADFDPNDQITFAQAQRLAEKKAKQAADSSRQQIESQMQIERKVQHAEAEARAKHSDYDYVINTFTLPQIQKDPALAHKIAISPNPALTAYKLGKLSDEYEAQSQQQNVSPKAAKILKNSERPASSHSAPVPLKSQVGDVSKMSQQEIWNLSQKYARGGR